MNEINHDVYVTNIFRKIQSATSQIVVNRGGTRSSKSYSTLQYLIFEKFLKEKNKNILILRKTLPSLWLSTLKAFNSILSSIPELYHEIKREKQFNNFYWGTNLIHFDSVDDPSKKKSTEWNYMFFEEANEFTWDDFKTLKLYLSAPSPENEKNQIFLALNPVDEFCWVKHKLIDSGQYDVTEIVSTYKDNVQNLNKDTIKDIENLANQDKNFYRIYCLGEWGRLEGVIYNNWDIVSSLPTDEEADEIIYGLDFGFNNPSALLKIIMKDREVWEKELLYDTNLTNDLLIKKLSVLIPKEGRTRSIFADAEAPEKIDEIYDAGYCIYPSIKGKTSVWDSIDAVKRKKIHIDRYSPNLIKEKKSYSWKKDKNGYFLDAPVKWMDHLMDAERYAIYTYEQDFGGGGAPSIRML